MQRLIAPDISTWPDESAQLIGSKCDECGAVTFPRQQRCPRCSKAAMSDLLLPRRGKIVAFTTQGFAPKLPYAGAQTADEFVPFGVGLIQLEDVVKVEARLTENDPEKLAHGMNVELTFIPFYTDENGDEVVTFAFQPV